MADRICVDTNILIEALRGKPDALAWLRDAERTALLATTEINAFELFHGAYKSKFSEENLAAAEAVLERLLPLPFSRKAARHAGELLAELEKKGEPIDVRDLFIGSIALVEGFRVKTRNVKHFERIEGLIVE